MRTYSTTMIVGLILAACDDSASPGGTGPSTAGILLVSTSTGGADPDEDGYLLMVDGQESLALDPTGVSEIRISSGRHRLQLIDVAAHCSVISGTSIEVDVPSQGTVSVAFDVSCPGKVDHPGAVLVTAPTAGPVPSSARYQVWYAHYGYWDYGGGPWTLLGALEPNGSLVAQVPASSASGADPYWYEFELRDIPATCTVQGGGPNPSTALAITAGDTLDVVFAVTCSP